MLFLSRPYNPWVLLVAVWALSTTAQAADWSALPATPSENGHASVLETFQLPPTDLAQLNPGIDLGSAALAAKYGYPKQNNPGIGSALVAVPGKPGEFFLMTDRGPNFDNVNGAGKVYGKVFPMPNFTPAIVHVKLEQGRINILRAIPLVDSAGKPVTGLTNSSDDETAYVNPEGSPLPFHPAGLDTEALQLLPDGRFLISEEYGPSVLVADANGKVLVRYVPMGKSYEGVNYPIKPILPAIFKQRRSNRGLENLALTPDGKTAYTVLQSPMGDAKNKAYANTRVVRILRLDVTDPLNAKVTGMFAVLQNPKSAYPETSKQADLKYSDAVALTQDKILLLERATKKFKLIIADLSQANNLLDSTVVKSEVDNSLIPEQEAEDLQKLGITAAPTMEVFDSRDVFFQIDTDKIEGLAVLSPSVVAISNDNDFGVGENTTDYPSKVWLIRLGHSLIDQ